MSRSTSTRKAWQYHLLAAAIALSSYTKPSMAHDGFSTPVVEGTNSDVSLNINHGCNEAPIIAQSVVFPGNSAVLTAFDAQFNSVTPPTDLGEFLEGGFLEGMIRLVQDNRIFKRQAHKKSPLENNIGFHSTNGSLSNDFEGQVPFKFFAPFFIPSSCVVEVQLVPAIADICNMSKPVLKDGKVNLFIPNNGSQFATQGLAAGVHGVGEPSRLIIKRDMQAHPLNAESCGQGITVIATVSAADIDAYLPVPGWKLPAAGNGN